jgi:hypothetical protein
MNCLNTEQAMATTTWATPTGVFHQQAIPTTAASTGSPLEFNQQTTATPLYTPVSPVTFNQPGMETANPLGAVNLPPAVTAVATPMLTPAAPMASPAAFQATNSPTVKTDVLHLGRDINVEPTLVQGQLRVDIRKWGDDGIRTRKGISLPVQCWQELIKCRQQLEENMEKMRDDQEVSDCCVLGDDIYATIKSPLWIIDIRNWYKSAECTFVKPGRRGIALKFPEFSKLMDYSGIIAQKLSGLQLQ